MALINNVPGDEITDVPADPKKRVRLGQGWISWFAQVFYLLSNITRSGTTAQRPTKNVWIGQPFFDTTLMAPVYAASVNPIVWVPAASGTLSFTWASGNTASRPVPTQVGQMYYDTTLTQPIWVQQISPAIWVNASGTTV